jgi:hypothetical protein
MTGYKGQDARGGRCVLTIDNPTKHPPYMSVMLQKQDIEGLLFTCHVGTYDKHEGLYCRSSRCIATCHHDGDQRWARPTSMT